MLQGFLFLKVLGLIKVNCISLGFPDNFKCWALKLLIGTSIGITASTLIPMRMGFFPWLTRYVCPKNVRQFLRSPVFILVESFLQSLEDYFICNICHVIGLWVVC